MMIRIFVLATATTIVLSARIRRDLTRTGCTPGETWVENKIQFECFDDPGVNGVRPVACVPEELVEYKAGDEWKSGNFEYKCEMSTDGMTLSLLVTGCLTPTGDPLPIGNTITVIGKGTYSCIRDEQGYVRRKHDGGCVVNGRLYHKGDKWYAGDTTVTCIHVNQGYEIHASACKTLNNEWVDVGAFTVINSQYKKCMANAVDASIGELVEASESDYLEWTEQGSDDDEISDSGSIGTGNANHKPKPSQDESTGGDSKPSSAESPTDTSPPAPDSGETVNPPIGPAPGFNDEGDDRGPAEEDSPNDTNTPAESPTDAEPAPVDQEQNQPEDTEDTNQTQSPDEPHIDNEEPNGNEAQPIDDTATTPMPIEIKPEEPNVTSAEEPSDTNNPAEAPTDSDPAPPTDQIDPGPTNGPSTNTDDTATTPMPIETTLEETNSTISEEPSDTNNPAEAPTDSDPAPPTDQIDPGPNNGNSTDTEPDQENPAEFPPSQDPLPVPEDNTNSTDACQDSHPSCVTLCNSLCDGSDDSSKEEPVGMAVRKKRSAQPSVQYSPNNVAYVSWREYNVGYYPTNGPSQPPHPANIDNGQCKDAANDSHALVKMLCPKSCGVCGQKIDPPTFLHQYMASGCVSAAGPIQTK